MSLPKRFRQAVFKESGGPLIIEEASLTPPAQGEILVQVEACGVCFSDTITQHMGGGLYDYPSHYN
jgi:Zn-dependent alcohol dehydrogenase